jgi:hypothetical protein
LKAETVLVVAHAGVLDIAWRLATGKKLDEKREHPVLNATPNWIAYEDGKWSLVDWASPEGRAEIAAPWDGRALPRREAARALIVDQANDILLMRYAGATPHFLALDIITGDAGRRRHGRQDYRRCVGRSMKRRASPFSIPVRSSRRANFRWRSATTGIRRWSAITSSAPNASRSSRAT